MFWIEEFLRRIILIFYFIFFFIKCDNGGLYVFIDIVINLFFFNEKKMI